MAVSNRITGAILHSRSSLTKGPPRFQTKSHWPLSLHSHIFWDRKLVIHELIYELQNRNFIRLNVSSKVEKDLPKAAWSIQNFRFCCRFNSLIGYLLWWIGLQHPDQANSFCEIHRDMESFSNVNFNCNRLVDVVEFERRNKFELFKNSSNEFGVGCTDLEIRQVSK